MAGAPHPGGPGTSLSDPISKTSVVDALADRIRQRILHNEIGPGEALRQEALAEAYGVSRMPVREALRLLEAEGLVVFHPHRGVVVSELSTTDIDELFDLRLTLEPELLERAAERASDAEIAATRQALDQERRAQEAGDTARWSALNRAFHACLYRPAGRPRTLALVQAVNANIDRYVGLQLEGGPPAWSQHEHGPVFERYAARDGAGAARMLHEHLVHARDELLAALKDHPALGGPSSP